MAESMRDRAFMQVLKGDADIALWYGVDGNVADSLLVERDAVLDDNGHAAQLSQVLGHEVLFMGTFDAPKVEALLTGVQYNGRS